MAENVVSPFNSPMKDDNLHKNIVSIITSLNTPGKSSDQGDSDTNSVHGYPKLDILKGEIVKSRAIKYNHLLIHCLS